MPVRGQRLARLLRLISLLKGPNVWTGRTLAEYFGTSRRNVQRDIAVLRLAGVPVIRDEEYGPNGSYRINREWYFPHVPLTDQECLDLSVLAKAVENQTLQLLDSMVAVRDKILDTLPPKQQNLIRDASELFEILSTGLANHKHCSRIMTNFQKALLTKRQVEGLYYSPHQRRAKKVDLQPRRVFLSGQAWYLAAHENRSEETKLYRLARFKDVKVTGKPITITAEWSLKSMLGHAWNVFRGKRDWHIEIEFDREAADLVEEVRWHETQQTERTSDGRLIFTATVSGLDEVKFWVLGWGPRALVRRPKELADEVERLAQEIVQNYQRPKQKPSKEKSS